MDLTDLADQNSNPLTNFTHHNIAHLYIVDTLNIYDRTLSTTSVRSKAGLLSTQQFQYDGLGNVTQVTDDQNHTTKFEHDLAGNVVASVTSADGTTWIRNEATYDPANRIKKVKSPTGQLTYYNYSLTGRLLNVKTGSAAQNLIRSNTFDVLDRLVQNYDVTRGTSQITYDAYSRIATTTDSSGRTVTMNYDLLNRVVETTDSSGEYTASVFDAVGRITSLSNSRSQVTTTYDNLDRPVQVQTQGVGELADYPGTNLSYNFDQGNRILGYSETNGSQATYGYDISDNLISLQAESGDAYNLTYDALNRLTKKQRGLSEATLAYTANSSLSGIVYRESSIKKDETILSFDSRDLVVAKKSTFGNSQYQFDSAGQLIQASNDFGSPTENYSYGENWDRASDNQNPTISLGTIGANLPEDAKYNYQTNTKGDVIAKVAKNAIDPSYYFTYNSLNQMVQARKISSTPISDETTINFRYDIAGRRIKKSLVSTSDSAKNYIRFFTYAGSALLAEFDGAGNTLARYSNYPNAIDKILSVEVTAAGVTAGLAKSAGKYFLTRDHLGSTTALINSAGQVVQRYNYTSFGEVTAIQDDLGNDISQNQNVNLRILFTGREWDSEIELYYFRARYYDPKLGRFYQADPAAGDQGNPITLTNAYIYANNNPVNFTDPMGLVAGTGQSSTPNPGGTSWADNNNNGGAGFDLDPNRQYCNKIPENCGGTGIFGVHMSVSRTKNGPLVAPPPAQPVAGALNVSAAVNYIATSHPEILPEYGLPKIISIQTNFSFGNGPISGHSFGPIILLNTAAIDDQADLVRTLGHELLHSQRPCHSSS